MNMAETQPETTPAPTECRACGSKRRTEYETTCRLDYDGNLIEFRRCRCTQCGQTRIDRFTTAKTAQKGR